MILVSHIEAEPLGIQVMKIGDKAHLQPIYSINLA